MVLQPTGWRPPNISKDQKANDVQQEDVGEEDEGARRAILWDINSGIQVESFVETDKGKDANSTNRKSVPNRKCG